VISFGMGFKPHLRKAPERLARTAEGTDLPANIIEEFRRDMARLALVREQINSIEKNTCRAAFAPRSIASIPWPCLASRWMRRELLSSLDALESTPLVENRPCDTGELVRKCDR
jgi:hypothetical protein